MFGPICKNVRNCFLKTNGAFNWKFMTAKGPPHSSNTSNVIIHTLSLSLPPSLSPPSPLFLLPQFMQWSMAIFDWQESAPTATPGAWRCFTRVAGERFAEEEERDLIIPHSTSTQMLPMQPADRWDWGLQWSTTVSITRQIRGECCSLFCCCVCCSCCFCFVVVVVVVVVVAAAVAELLLLLLWLPAVHDCLPNKHPWNDLGETC